MPVTRRQMLHQLDGGNAEEEVKGSRAHQAPRTHVREQYIAENLEWTENPPDRCDPDVNADHQMVTYVVAQANTYFGTGF